MCNIGGYIGKSSAAPILLKMMEKQEGFGGGYYSGIATIHNGKLHFAKTVGNIATLRRETNAETLPGNIGIIHSRPNLIGGTKEWAHPFINQEKTMAYLANGHPGFFEDIENQNKILKEMLANGCTFQSAMHIDQSEQWTLPKLPDGRALHTSELMCHYMSSLIDKYKNCSQGMREAYMTYPGELVGLCLHTNSPEQITAARLNQPLMLGFGNDEVYMASTAIAIPETEVYQIHPMAISCTASISANKMELFPFRPTHGNVENVFPYAECCQAILSILLKDKGKCFQDLKNITAPLWSTKTAPQKDMLCYEILRSLYKSGNVRLESCEIEGINKTSASTTQIFLT